MNTRSQQQQSKPGVNGAYRNLPLTTPNHIANQRQSTYYNIHNDRVRLEGRPLPSFVNTARRQHGSMAIELGIASLVTIFVVAFALNICFALISFGVNDRACRDAARAASQGTSAQESRIMAERILKTYGRQSNLMDPLQITSFRYEDFAGKPPAGSSPYVVVTTASRVKMPAPVAVFGESVFGQKVSIQKTYAFPIVRLTLRN